MQALIFKKNKDLVLDKQKTNLYSYIYIFSAVFAHNLFLHTFLLTALSKIFIISHLLFSMSYISVHSTS